MQRKAKKNLEILKNANTIPYLNNAKILLSERIGMLTSHFL